jgi:hypothetical protein
LDYLCFWGGTRKGGDPKSKEIKMDDSFEVLRKGRLNGNQKNKLARLLDMFYMPSELAEEVGFNKRQIYRVYIPVGCPYVKDVNNHIWINGKNFRDWVVDVYRKCEVTKNQAFCITCKKAVNMIDPVMKEEGRLSYYICNCPNCGRKLARIITMGKRE